METENIQIHINSKHRSHGEINDAYFYISTIEVPSDYTLHLSVLSASIPYSFYNVNSSNNRLLLQIGANLYTFILNTGNYSINDFLTELRNKLGFMTITYDKIKSKLSFTYPTSNFSFIPASTCLELLGFTSLSNLTSFNNTLTSENCVNLQSYHCICVGTNFISNSINAVDQKNPTILCSIPITTAPNSMISYINPSNYKINIFSSMFSSINIKILNQNGEPIDLNGCHWSMTLQLDVLQFAE